MRGHIGNTKHIDVTSLMFCNTGQKRLGESWLGYCEDGIGSVSSYTQNSEYQYHIENVNVRIGASLFSDQGK